MDLTYTPGELDSKNARKGEGFDMKREHDSVDDFEHLDPELSPVDVQAKEFFGLDERHGAKVDNLNDTSMKKANVIDMHSDAFPSGELSAMNKPSEPFVGHTSGIDLLSDFGTDHHQFYSNIDFNNQDKSGILDFGIGGNLDSNTVNAKNEADSMNKRFISAEIADNNDKTDHERDLLNLGSKAKDKDVIRDLQETTVLKEPSGEKIPFKDSEPDSTKSMKEIDALAHYDLKYERKTSPVEIKDELSSMGSEEKVGPYYNNETVESQEAGELNLKVDKIVSSEEIDLEKKPEAPVTDPHKIELIKEQDIINQYEETKQSDDEEPSRPFIAICPGKPSSSETTKIEKSVKKISLDLDDIIGPEDVFKRIGLVEALVYWRDPKKSGVVFGGVMAILLSLCYMSLISVVAYSSLLALTGTICFRIYKNILQAVQKTSEGHPFKEFLDLELSLPQDKVREMADTAVVHINAAIVELRRLFLVEDLIDSIKFGVCLWCLTYVGAIFNGMTIVILAFVALFTVPKIYENNKASIDTYIDMGRSKVAEITSKVKAAVPIGKKEPEKDKEQ